ncbi:MAG: hypothetical protein KDB41_06005 [Propionibacteriaceae bacterium]|nr:hypothetical protein [Propionibacteriaceae bacterium]
MPQGDPADDDQPLAEEGARPGRAGRRRQQGGDGQAGPQEEQADKQLLEPATADRCPLYVKPVQPLREHAEDAADATNRMSIRGRKLLRRLGGDEGQKVLLDRYAQVLAGAVRDELAPVDPAGDVPLFVFANEPLSSMIVAHGLPGEVVVVRGAADELRPDQIDEAIRERIGEITARRLSAAADKIGDGFAAGLAGTDVAQAARAAAVGAVGTLYYDMTADVRGTLDADTGAITFDENGEDLLAAIALLVLANGGEVHAVRPGEIDAEIWNGRLLAGLRRALA